MAVLGRIVTLVTYVVERRRLNWVEISVTRAWSRDRPAGATEPRR